MSGTASPQEEARLALEQIDAVLRQKPEKDDLALSAATQKLCLWRDALIAEARRGGAAERRRLERANAVLSVVVATHFPAGAVPWEGLAGARTWLGELLDEAPAAAS